MKNSDNMKIRHYAKYKLKGVFSNILNQNFVTSQTNENLVLDITLFFKTFLCIIKNVIKLNSSNTILLKIMKNIE